MNESELLELLQGANPENDDQFCDIVLNCMEIFALDDRGLGREFGVSRTTVNRWANGISAPHPAMRRLLFGSLIEKVQARVAMRKKVRRKRLLIQKTRKKNNLGSGSHKVPATA